MGEMIWIQEAADRLNIHVRTLTRARQAGMIKAKHRGKKWYVDEDYINELFEFKYSHDNQEYKNLKRDYTPIKRNSTEDYEELVTEIRVLTRNFDQGGIEDTYEKEFLEDAEIMADNCIHNENIQIKSRELKEEIRDIRRREFHWICKKKK